MFLVSFFRLLSPLSAVPLVALAGFGLYELGFPLVCYCFLLLISHNVFWQFLEYCFCSFNLQLAKCIEIGLPELILLLVFSQYIPHLMRGERHGFHRFAVIFSVVIVWIYAHFLTIGGAYKHTGINTQNSCRTDRSGLIGGAPW